MTKFYKGVLVKDLNPNYVPGTVATEFKVALEWAERINSNKKKGAAKHVRHGDSCVIEIEYNGELLSHDEFQRSGVKEHERMSCWTSSAKDKAQLNIPCKYRILSTEEINQLYKP